MAPAAPLLPPEDLASQLSTIEVLLSIYNGTTELIPSKAGDGDGKAVGEDAGEEEGGDLLISAETYVAIRNLAAFLNLPLESLGGEKSVRLRDSIPTVVQIGIKMDPMRGTLDESDKDQGRQHLVLFVGFAMRRVRESSSSSDDDDDDMLLKPRWHLKQADWMNRSVHESLSQSAKGIQWEAEGSVDYIMNIVETISEASVEHIKTYSSERSSGSAIDEQPHQPGGGKAKGEQGVTTASSIPPSTTILRSWHLFPSLSMKDKRRDLVNYANDCHFTGFVLAGKPGLVVLESPLGSSFSSPSSMTEASRQMDDFWSDIKTTSWSDLPASHKKVSERYREENVPRCFDGNVQDITAIDALGGIDVEQGGRVRTPDLEKVRLFLQNKGCIGQLDIVLGKEA